MSLLNPTEANKSLPEDVQYEHQAKSPDWYLREGVPGEGPKPDWLLDKYNGNMEAQAKAYVDLMKVTRTDAVAPESYDLSHVADVFNPEDPRVASLTSKAKAHKVSQEVFSDLVEEFATYQKSLMPNMDEEIKKLGDNPQRRLDTVNTWASNHLSKRSLETIGKVGYTADFVELMDEIRQIHHGMKSQIPLGQNVEPVKLESVAEIDAEMFSNYAKYKTDAAYRAKLTARRAQAIGEE